MWLIGTVRTQPETVISRVWALNPGINCFRINGVHGLRLISGAAKRVWGCHVESVTVSLSETTALWRFINTCIYLFIYWYTVSRPCNRLPRQLRRRLARVYTALLTVSAKTDTSPSRCIRRHSCSHCSSPSQIRAWMKAGISQRFSRSAKFPGYYTHYAHTQRAQWMQERV